MQAHHPQICLFEPEIPQNVGAIARLAAATMCRLHVVKPCAFSLDDRNLRRPGLDYWPFLDLEIHDDLATVLSLCGHRAAFFSKRGVRPYTLVPQTTEVLVFGRETSGLPLPIWERFAAHFYAIPMFHPGVRSLNVANAAAIVVYDQLYRRGLFAEGPIDDRDSAKNTRRDVGRKLLSSGTPQGGRLQP